MSFQDDIQKAFAARRAAIAQNLGIRGEDSLEKGGKKANIGEIRTHGGVQMQKTADGWKKTTSGKSIPHKYADHDSNFSHEDLKEAHDHHNSEYIRLRDKLVAKKQKENAAQGKTGMIMSYELGKNEEDRKDYEQMEHHQDQAAKYNAKIETLKRIASRKSSDLPEGYIGKTSSGKLIHKDAEHKDHANFKHKDHVNAVDEIQRHINRLSDDQVAKDSSYNIYNEHSDHRVLASKNPEVKHLIQQQKKHRQLAKIAKAKAATERAEKAKAKLQNMK